MNKISVGSFVLKINRSKNIENTFTLSDQYFEKLWKNHTSMLDKRRKYCVCSFLKQIFVIWGTSNGFSCSNSFSNSCMKYDLNTEQWTNIAKLKENISRSPCTVFEGKCVLTGGICKNKRLIKSVETYDHHKNKWNFLPEMIYEWYFHEVVSMGNKIFVVGGSGLTECEVFDSFSRKFTLIKRIPCDVYILCNNIILTKF